MTLQEQLDPLWGSVVKNQVFDPLGQRFQLEVEVVDNADKQFHTIEFTGVTGFLFFGTEGTASSPDDGSYLELTSIHFEELPIGDAGVENPSPAWRLHEFRSRPNFALELWDAWLLLQASCVTIDGKTFQVTST